MPLTPFDDPRRMRVEAALRAGAGAFGPRPPASLRPRILAALRSPAPPVARSRAKRLAWLAAAAVLFATLLALGLTRSEGLRASQAARLTRLAQGVLGAGKDVLGLPGEAKGSLQGEAERLLADTARAAQGVVRGLPGPLRQRLERM